MLDFVDNDCDGIIDEDDPTCLDCTHLPFQAEVTAEDDFLGAVDSVINLTDEDVDPAGGSSQVSFGPLVDVTVYSNLSNGIAGLNGERGACSL